MGLPQARPAEKEQRIERCVARGIGNGVPCENSHLVALPFNQVHEAVDRIQARVDADLGYAREHERTWTAVRGICVDAHARGGILRRELHGISFSHGMYLVDELRARAYYTVQHALQDF